MAGGDPARIGGLAGAIGDPRVQDRGDRLRSGRHVGPLADADDAMVQQGFRIGPGQFVLGRAREGGLRFEPPDGMPVVRIIRHRNEGGIRVALGVLGQRLPVLLLQQLQGVQIDAAGVVNGAAGVRAADRNCPQVVELFDGVGGDVAGPRHQTGLPPQILLALPQHLFGEIDASVAGGLGPPDGTAPSQTLAGDGAIEPTRHAAIRSVEVTDFAGSDPDVSGRNVGGGPDVVVEFRHEGLAKPHDLPLRTSFGVEVGASFGSSQRETGQGVFEYLLKPKELDHTRIHTRVETQSPLEGAEGRVELDPVSLVDPHLASVGHPGHAKHDLSFRLDQTLHDAVARIALVALQNRFDRFQNLFRGLIKFFLPRAAFLQSGDGVVYVGHSFFKYRSPGRLVFLAEGFRLKLIAITPGCRVKIETPAGRSFGVPPGRIKLVFQEAGEFRDAAWRQPAAKAPKTWPIWSRIRRKASISDSPGRAACGGSWKLQ